MSKDDELLESYPPLFRQAAQQINLNIVERISSADPDDPIPTIDLEALSLESLADACENWGVFRLVNHGVPAALFSHLHHTSKHLFSLPFHTKQTLFGGTSSSSSYFWGTPALSPSGTALPSKLLPNWVEGFCAALSQHDPLLPSHHHPPILNTFRNLVEEYGKHMGRIARALGESMGKNLKMNSSDKTSEVVLSEETSILRVYRYPIMRTCNENTWGMDAHTDSSVISIILCQDDVASLEFLKVKDDSNKWHLVKPVPNSLVIQLGDMMQAMSDDRYTSVRHRVRVNRYKERVSFGYFVFPQDDHVILSSKYKPFSYSDFRAQVQQDLQTIGRKVGLERFKLKGP